MANKQDTNKESINNDYFSGDQGKSLKIIEHEHKLRITNLKEEEKIREEQLRQLARLEKVLDKAREENNLNLIKETEAQKKKIEEKNARDVYLLRQEMQYKYADVEEKLGLIRENAAKTERVIQEEINDLILQGGEYEGRIAELKKQQASIVADSIRKEKDINAARIKSIEAYGTIQEKLEAKKKRAETANDKLKTEREKKFQKLVLDHQGKLSKEQEKEYKKRIEQEEDIKALKEEASEANTEAKKATAAEYVRKSVSSITNALASAFKSLESNMYLYTENSGLLSTRLMGSNYTWSRISENVSSTLVSSGIITQKKMVESLTKLIEAGVSDELQQRAFLLSVQENIATTFDAANGTLLRIIRLQETNSTAQRMAMEANLNEFLNSYFEDTSYLTETLDSVTNALLEATALFNDAQGAEFEYTIQKWLGALTAKGLSSNAASSIATGLGYLFSGDVQALSSNDSLQSLLAMSASRAGLSYSDLLLSGGSASGAEDVNKLLESMVEYLKEIAENNNVVKSEYAHLYGLSQSDLVAIANLKPTDISNISNANYSYSRAGIDIQNLLNTTTTRVSASTQWKNIMNNVETTAAARITESAGAYTTYAVADLLEKYAGGIDLPTVSVMGNSVDLPKISDLLKTTIFGLSALGAVGSALSSEAGDDLQLRTWIGFDNNASASSNFFNRPEEKVSSLNQDQIIKEATEDAKKNAEKNQDTITSTENSSSSSSGYFNGDVYIENISDDASKSIGQAVSEAITSSNSSGSSALDVNVVSIAEGIIPKFFGSSGGVTVTGNSKDYYDVSIVGIADELKDYLGSIKGTLDSTKLATNLDNVQGFLALLVDSNHRIEDSIEDTNASYNIAEQESILSDISSTAKAALSDIMPTSIRVSEVPSNVLSALQKQSVGDTNVTIDSTVTAAISDALVKAITDSLSENNLSKNITLLQAIYDMRDSLKNIALSNYQETSNGNLSVSDLLNSINDLLKKEVSVRVNNIDFDDAMDKLSDYLTKNMF